MRKKSLNPGFSPLVYSDILDASSSELYYPERIASGIAKSAGQRSRGLGNGEVLSTSTSWAGVPASSSGYLSAGVRLGSATCLQLFCNQFDACNSIPLLFPTFFDDTCKWETKVATTPMA